MSLAVEASVGPDARWPTTIPVHVRIRNDGEAPVRVARRLAVGYRGSDGRELFAEVHPPGSDELVSRQTKLYDRDPAKPEEYVPLAPGEELATDFDLIRWYALPGPRQLRAAGLLRGRRDARPAGRRGRPGRVRLRAGPVRSA